MSNEENTEVVKGGIQENVYVEDIVSITTQIDEKGVAILFTFIDDETSVLEAAITDNYVETNYAQQDHIAIKPRIYRLRGCVGEVVYKGSTEWNDWITDEISNHPVLQKTLDFLQPILAVSGVVNSAIQSARNVINQLESSYNRYKKMVQNLFITRQNQLTGQMQETVVADLNRILELRVPVNLKGLKFEKTLDKGNNYKRTYYLQSVSAHQGSNNFISDIEVTIKEFRIATTDVVALDPQQYGAFKVDTSATQKSSEVNEGAAAVQEPPKPAVDAAIKTMQNLKENHPIIANTVKSVYNAMNIGSKGIGNNGIVQNSALYKLGTGAFNMIGRTMANFVGRK